MKNWWQPWNIRVEVSGEIESPRRQTPILTLSGLSKNVWIWPTWKWWSEKKSTNDWQFEFRFLNNRYDSIDKLYISSFLASKLDVPTLNTKLLFLLPHDFTKLL
jgi:hypothetical protein